MHDTLRYLFISGVSVRELVAIAHSLGSTRPVSDCIRALRGYLRPANGAALTDATL